MVDGWEKAFRCQEVCRATLPGYSRALNKKSIRNWGSPATPGPTLNLVPSQMGRCTGLAFRFDENDAPAVLSALVAREGKNFSLTPLPIQLDAGDAEAVVPLYVGNGLFSTRDPHELAVFALAAEGSSGRCRDYVGQIHALLRNMNIEDPAVSEVWERLQTLIAERQ